MTPLSQIRIAAFILTIAVAAWAGPLGFMTVVASLALVHYFVAMVYSRRQIATVIGKPVPAVLATGLSLSAVAFYALGARLAVLFLPHHVFNEIYIGKKELFPGKEQEVRWVIWSSLLLNTALYGTIFGSHGSFWLFSPQFTQPLMMVAVPWFAFSLFQIRSLLSPRLLFDVCLLELLSVAAIVIAQFYPVSIWHIVMYHITFWAMYPLHKMWKPGCPRPAVAYVALNVVLVALLLAISPMGISPWRLASHVLREQFTFWSIFHIMISFAISKAQPEWIWRIFLPPSPVFVSPGGQDLSKIPAASASAAR